MSHYEQVPGASSVVTIPTYLQQHESSHNLPRRDGIRTERTLVAEPLPSTTPVTDVTDKTISSIWRALLLQFLTTLSTILFTVIPVVVTAGGEASWGNWYGWRDAFRLIEPFCSGLLHSWFFYNSDIMRRWSGNVPDTRNTPFKDSRRFRSLLSTTFTFFLILYVTGAQIHTAAAFFKNIIVLFLEAHSQGIGLSTHPLTKGDGQLSLELAEQLKDGYMLIQDVWEHSASHYMYAFGALGMSWCEMIAYSGQVFPEGKSLVWMGKTKKGTKSDDTRQTDKEGSKWLGAFWVLVGVLYGAIVAGVACQYPKGLYVGSVYVILLFMVLCIYILIKTGDGPKSLLSFGRYYIIQTYIIACIVAAIVIFIYLAVHRFDFISSNDRSHALSMSRP